jgi:hypothetical protein
LVAATPEVITPAVAPRVKQWDASTGTAVESFGSVTFEQIAAPAGKSEVVRDCEATPGTRDNMLDFEEGLSDHVLIALTILATPIGAGFNKVTGVTRRMCHLASSGLLGQRL